MRGKIPVTEKIELESDESKWRLLTSGLINDLPTTGIVYSCDGKRVRISLVIKTIIAPENMRNDFSCSIQGNLSEEISTGHSRIYEHLMKQVYGSAWIFYGYISGNKNKPIVINHFPSLNMSIYSQKLEKEEVNIFMPTYHLN